jgi:hypothetical protein
MSCGDLGLAGMDEAIKTPRIPKSALWNSMITKDRIQSVLFKVKWCLLLSSALLKTT